MGGCSYAQSLSPTTPAAVGLSSKRLARLTGMMQKEVDRGHVAGAVALVARQGKVAYLESVGMLDREAGKPMSSDALFRIASMTKPITSVAVLMLYEEGRFQLGDPVSRYIPAFKHPKVLADANEIIPAGREITIKHLLTHMSGLTYQWDKRLGGQYRERGITRGILPDKDRLADDIKRLAEAPLVHPPGQAWTYGLSTDVLGYLVEVVSGRSLEEFFQRRIFRPLGMVDTHFLVPEEKRKRLAAVYAPDKEGGIKRLSDDPIVEGNMIYSVDYPVRQDHLYRSGGGGLCATITDYARFCQMLLNGGELDGVRLLSRKTVELMTTDHVGDLKKDSGFGLGVSVVRNLREAGALTSLGTFGWGGFWYTAFFIDPTEQLIGICMGQLHPTGPAVLNKHFSTLVYQAIMD